MKVKRNTVSCTLCPRVCGADREKNLGFCRCTNTVHVARASLHKWEEPCISGTRGSGTVFFGGCTLRCVFCQNYEISRRQAGREVSEEQLADIFRSLCRDGAHNINLVTPTQYVPSIIRALDAAKPNVPVVYNSGGYESVQTVESMKGKINVYLPDVKFFSPDISGRYAGAPDYFERAIAALHVMTEQVGSPVFDGDGMLVRGVMVRHLVLPGTRQDSIDVIRSLAREFSPDEILISLMSQYTPVPGMSYPLSRRITTFEYESVADEVRRAGFRGYMQERSSAQKSYIPPFDT